MEIISDTDHLFSIELITYLDIVKILRHLVEDETSISSLGILFTEVAPLYDRDADEASLIGVVTMACSLFTLPALIWVYEAVTALIR